MGDVRALRKLLAGARSRADPASWPELRSALVQRDARGRRAEDGGLTQAHMDQLLCRAAGTYNRLERGTAVPEVLLRDVARILRLTDQEWGALWRYAFAKEPPYPLDADLGLVIPGAWKVALRSIGSMAYITDRDWNVVDHNEAFSRMFLRRQVPHNTMRWMLTDAEARITLADWHTAWAPLLVAQLRAAVALDPESRTLITLHREVRADPVSGPIYEAAGGQAYIQPRAEAPRPLHHAELGPGWATMCAAGPFGSPGARCIIVLFDEGPPPPPRLPMRAEPLDAQTPDLLERSDAAADGRFVSHSALCGSSQPSWGRKSPQ
ncbi:XRE family transcriptional regulator [Streptomyces sp. H10-C2]|uniref:MmyB family transcriptional regulator n=1 Tax=unclassified Streptomyces TaxID=2593676 RepID=UPI0024B8E420|nr:MULTISPECIES: XRE family transcriptional regulator [unclassified Streptomyces]MDJ0344815.1 XRE family transcriptional regulator [Streptomyces sp. PH10-H1]MDJ0369700.1 XRE family transcriptional regulator [Streptomyces sp. H10-C2]